MISLLLASYALITWLLFIRWRLLPWKIYTIIPVVTCPVVAIVVMILLLNVFAPTSSDVRVTRYEVPIVPHYLFYSALESRFGVVEMRKILFGNKE